MKTTHCFNMKKYPARAIPNDDCCNLSSTAQVFYRGIERIASLYEYFPGKEAIFAEVRRREDRKMYELKNPRPKSVKFFIRAGRAIIDNYVLHAPEALADSTLLDMIVELGERYFLR